MVPNGFVMWGAAFAMLFPMNYPLQTTFYNLWSLSLVLGASLLGSSKVEDKF
jgi:hypothetical protein